MKKSLLFLVVAVFLSGCGKTAVDPSVVYEGDYKSYVKVLDQWTRSQKVYEPSFDTVMIATATYKSAAFRKAYVEEKTRAEALPEKDSARLLETQMSRAQNVAEFFVAFYIPERKHNKLHKASPGWRLWLVDDKGRKAAPLNVKLIRKTNVADKKFFPYIDRWSKCYQVKFPRQSVDGEKLELDSGDVSLEIKGAPGDAELVWRIPE